MDWVGCVLSKIKNLSRLLEKQPQKSPQQIVLPLPGSKFLNREVVQKEPILLSILNVVRQR